MVLVNRLKTVMNKVVSEHQSAFLSGRHILDGPLVANEVIAWAKKRERRIFMFKIDFDKAYDNVNWEFLLSVLAQMGFPSEWCNWIRGILLATRSSVLVNGSLTFEFGCQKGIRQGDPLSPFLFIILMEAFSGMMKQACDIGTFHGIILPNEGPKLSHLLYADDAMIMGEWSSFNFDNLKHVLRIFYLCSGLKINLHKSVLFGVEVEDGEIDIQAGSMGCKAGRIPFSYLGIMVGANMNRVANWDPVVSKFNKRLSKWKVNSLSIAGRLTLIKSVLDSLPTYYFSLFKAPKKVINELEALMRIFLWGGSDEVRKTSWVAWEVVTKPIKEGGLGIASLEINNLALISKWLGRFLNDYQAMWRRVVLSIHGSSRGWGLAPVNNGVPGVWKNWVLVWNKFKVDGVGLNRMIWATVGNGRQIRFWLDLWLGSELLLDKFPTLYALDKHKNSLLADRMVVIGSLRRIVWDWIRAPSTQQELIEKQELEDLLVGVVMAEREDSWSWAVGRSNEFEVSAIKKWMVRSDDVIGVFGFHWSNWVPKKCNIFMWRAVLDRLPTKEALARCHIQYGDHTCVLCESNDESLEHLLTGCITSTGVWNAVASWCNIPRPFVFHVNDLVELHKLSGVSGNKRSIIHGIVIITCWRIWRARNEKIFSGKDTKVVEMVADIKSLGFLWFKNRSKLGVVDWNRWCLFDVT